MKETIIKKQYSSPEAKIVFFGSDDIITSSAIQVKPEKGDFLGEDNFS